MKSYYNEYRPVCPIGITDCVMDPAYIKHWHPKWYEEMYGNLSPEEVVKQKGCFDDNGYGDFGAVAGFWSATEYNGDRACDRNLRYDGTGVNRNHYIIKTRAYSVRCVRD